MNCRNCSAPLPPHSDLCQYCGALNDTDLSRLGEGVSASWNQDSQWVCPHCDVNLKGLNLELEKTYRVERCPECMGIFFSPPGELEDLLDTAIPYIDEIDFERLNNLSEESKGEQAGGVKYVKCPNCRKLMNRKNYGSKAGVIVDTCKDHGIWLDGGELGKLVRWARAGGRQKAAQWREEQQRQEERRRRFLRSSNDSFSFDDRW